MRWTPSIMAVALIVRAAPAAADVEIDFYSRPGDGRTFPHAFVTIHGVIGPGRIPVDRAIGFTAVRVSLDILRGPVPGAVVVEPPAFIARSERQVALRLSDDRYGRVDAAIRRWTASPQPSYRLDRRNCINFVAEIARASGLRVPPADRYRHDPHGFLAALGAANARPRTPRTALSRTLV